MKHPGELNVLARTLFLKCADEPATGFMRVELVALIKIDSSTPREIVTEKCGCFDLNIGS